MTTFFTWSLGVDINQCSVTEETRPDEGQRKGCTKAMGCSERGSKLVRRNVWNENKRTIFLFVSNLLNIINYFQIILCFFIHIVNIFKDAVKIF